MATYYWVGGSAVWNAAATTNWAASTGGAGGAGVPNGNDDAIIDINSGTGTIVCTGANCNNLIVTANQNLTLGGSTSTLAIYGNVLLPPLANTFLWRVTTTSFLGSGNKILDFNSRSVGQYTQNVSSIILNNPTGYFTLANNYNAVQTSSITLTNGTFDTAGYNANTNSLISNNSNPRSVYLRNSTCGISTLTFTNSNNLNFYANTSSISSGGGSLTINGGNPGVVLNNVTANFISSTISGNTTFNNFTFDPTSFIGTTKNLYLSPGSNTVITGSMFVTGSSVHAGKIIISADGVNKTTNRPSLTVNSWPNPYGLLFANIDVKGNVAPLDLTNYYGNDATNNSGIIFPAPKTVYWNLSGGQNINSVAWANTALGTPASNNYPLCQDTATFVNSSNTATSIGMNNADYLGNWNMSALTKTISLTTSTDVIWTGNVSFGNNTTFTWPGATSAYSFLTFAGESQQKLISNGAKSGTRTNSGAFNMVVNTGANGSVILGDDLTWGNSSSITVTTGTLDTNSKNVLVDVFTTSGTQSKTIKLGSSVLSVNTSLTLTTANTVVMANTSNINYISSHAAIFNVGANSNYYIINKANTGILTVTSGSNTTIYDIKNTVANANVRFASSATFTNFSLKGNSTSYFTVSSSAAGTARSLSTNSAKIGYDADWLNVIDIIGVPIPNANAYIWYLGKNSINGGNNSGVAFLDGITTSAHLLTSGTTWTVPADWNNANNTVHMIGAGGGGATAAVSGNNRAAGGGGGGGGYTVLTNQTLTGAIPYTIGTSAQNANGGSTTFNTTNTAGGGQKGNATTTPTSSGGAGGTGTYAGGTGGAGAFGTVALTGYGSGGGGGAGGVNGIGGNGGNGISGLSTASLAGGGGGGNGGGSAGGNASPSTQGNGGNNFGGIGGGTTNGASGTLGGGGAGGAFVTVGGAGGSGIDISNTIGGAGGKGGNPTGTSSTNAGLYGGGGAGGGVTLAGTIGTGGAGSQGVIFIIYTPSAAPSSQNSNFFLMFG
jgi:hypothetical protein